jgi:large subunit ribosomal protein L30
MASRPDEARGSSRLVITQKKSAIGGSPAQRRTMRTLGLRKIGHSVTHADSPSLRGMLRTVGHLIEVQEENS